MATEVTKRIRNRAAAIANPELTDPKDIRWERSADPHQKVFDLSSRMARASSTRLRGQDLFYMCLYGDAEIAASLGNVERFIPQTMTTNIVRRQVDAYVAKMTVARPLPMALTYGGNYSEQRRSKSTTKFFEAVLDHVGYYRVRPLRLRDAAICGSGFAQNYRLGRKLFHKRRFPWEFQNDKREARLGEPKTVILNHLVDSLELCDRWPKHADAIMKSKQSDLDDRYGITVDTTSDLRVVKEPWRLPTGEDPKTEKPRGGAHAICVSEATLERGEYFNEKFPFSKVDFAPPIEGWRGHGMVELLAGLQFEVNSIGLRLQEQGYLTGSYVFIEDGSSVDTETIDNGALTIVRYSGVKPDFQNPSPWHPQFFEYLQALRGPFASDVTGMSSASVRGEKEAGLDSGKALRVHKDIQAETFTVQGRDDEFDCIDTAWQFFGLMEEIEHDPDLDESKRSYQVQYETHERGRPLLNKADFKGVKIDRENLRLRVFPTSFLSSTPEDKWSQVAEMAKAGLFAEDELLTLLDYPDVERVLNLRNAGRRVIEAIVDKFLASDTPPGIVPESTMNLDLAVVIGTLAYLEAKWLDDAPEVRTSALLDFVLAAKKQRDKNKAREAMIAQGQVPPDDDAPEPETTMAGGLPSPDDTMAGNPMAGPQYAPPDQQPLPAEAVAPQVMPGPGGVT